MFMTSLKIAKGAYKCCESKKNRQRLNRKKYEQAKNSPPTTTQKTKTNHEPHESHKNEDELR